jgi:hypothetical protein
MRINDLDYQINWRKFKRGTSFFVPCLKLEESKTTVLAVTKRLGFKVAIKAVIEDGVKGLRVWRK